MSFLPSWWRREPARAGAALVIFVNSIIALVVALELISLDATQLALVYLVVLNGVVLFVGNRAEVRTRQDHLPPGALAGAAGSVSRGRDVPLATIGPRAHRGGPAMKGEGRRIIVPPDLALPADQSEHARPAPPDGERHTQVEVTMIERADGALRLARVAAIIAADRDAQAAKARGLAA